MNPTINTLFYSRTCEHSVKLFKLLQSEGLLEHFKLYCVDDRLDKIPPHIKMVPTMIVSNMNKPLEGQAAFEWIQQMKFLKQSHTTNSNQQNIINKNMLNIPKNNGPIAFVEQEMTGISDGFAYTKTDKPLTHSFFNYKSEDKSTIFTAPEQGKLGISEQSKRIKDIEEKRNVQDQEYTKSMKDQQIQAVFIAEQDAIENPQNNKKKGRQDNNPDTQQSIVLQRQQQMHQLNQMQRQQQLNGGNRHR
jgi:hypothetical protein